VQIVQITIDLNLVIITVILNVVNRRARTTKRNVAVNCFTMAYLNGRLTSTHCRRKHKSNRNVLNCGMPVQCSLFQFSAFLSLCRRF